MPEELFIYGARLVLVLMAYPILAALAKRILACLRGSDRAFARQQLLWRDW